MAELVPHPLVTSVALKLGEPAGSPLATEADRLLKATKKAGEAATAAATAVDAEHATQKNALAKAFANQANLPGLSLFAGYLGGPVDGEDKRKWRLLYLDSRLDAWLLVPLDAIIVSQQLKDENAPFGMRDVLWVDSTANLVHGSGPRTNEGRFLVGEITRAGDFAASTTGSTFSVATGLLCETTTPGRCLTSRTR